MVASHPSITSLARVHPKSITILVLAVLVKLPFLSIAQPVEIGSRAAPSRDHHLFVGIDLFLQQENTEQKIGKLDGENAVLANPERDRINLISTSGLRWKMATKVSPILVNIANLEIEETATLLYGEGLSRLSNQIGLQIMADQSLDRAELADRDGHLNMDSSGGASLTDGADADSIGMSPLDQALGLGESLADAGVLGATSGDEDDLDVNAVEVTFEISSDHPIADAHIFGTAVIWANDDFMDIIFHQNIGRIDQNPQKITILQPGLPPNFEIKQSTIHVFNQGEEIATNHSEKHYELTAEEAREFVKVDHISTHRRDTTAALPSWPLAPFDLHATPREEDFDYLVTVKISDSGQLQSIEAGNQVLPDQVKRVVENIIYLPALENGTPVASTLSFNVGDFFKN